MTTTIEERQHILGQLNHLADEDIANVWRQLTALDDASFQQMMIDAFPQLLEPYAATAAELGVEWYAESAPALPYQPEVFLPDEAGLPTSAAWALGASGDAALTRLSGVAQRHIWTANRDTIIGNSNNEAGATWARVARPGACAFCAMAATRGAVYASKESALQVVGRGKEISFADRRARAAGHNRVNGRTAAGGTRTRGAQKLGRKYHDHCHCQAKEVRPGESYQPPDYVEAWEQAYVTATRETPGTGKYDAIDTNAVLTHMRQSLGTH